MSVQIGSETVETVPAEPFLLINTAFKRGVNEKSKQISRFNGFKEFDTQLSIILLKNSGFTIRSPMFISPLQG